MLFRFDVLAAVIHNHLVPILRVFGLVGEGALRYFGVGDLELAVFLLLDVAVVVFHKQVDEQVVPGFAHLLGGLHGIVVQLLTHQIGIGVIKSGQGAVHVCNLFHKTSLEAVLFLVDVLDHVVIAAIDEVADLGEGPECGGGGVLDHGAVALLVFVRDLGDAAEHGHIAAAGGVIDAEPEDAAEHVGQPVAALGHEGEAGLLGGGGALVDVLLTVVFPVHRSPAIGALVRAGAEVLGHVHGGALVMVAHSGHHEADIDFVLVGGFDPQGEAVLEVVAAGVVLVLGHLGGVAAVEEGPHAGFAAAGGAEIDGRVGVAEAELCIRGLFGIGGIEPFQSGEGDDVVGIDGLDAGQEDLVEFLAGDGGLAVAQREGGDARLVGVSADVAVGDAAGHPYGAVAPAFDHLALGVKHLLALADELHNPGLLGINDGEGLALGGVAVGVHQLGNDLDGLAGVLGALQGNVNQGAVVDHPLALFQFLDAAVGGLADGQLPLVHVADNRVGVRHLRDLAEQLARVPLDDIHHRAGGIVLGRAVVKFTVKLVRVGGVGDEAGTVPAGAFRDNEVGAGHRGAYRHQPHKQCKQKSFFHRQCICV